MTGKINGYINTWERRCYFNGIPDEAPIEIFNMVPSYKRICIAILKNDYPLKTLGFTPPNSEYYGILKRIEIDQRPKEGIPRRKNKQYNMTNSELQQFSFNIINTLIAKQCYIKGYGKLYRVMDKNHNPVINITKKQFDVLKLNQIIQGKDLIYVVVVVANPFSTGVQIKLPKTYQDEVA